MKWTKSNIQFVVKTKSNTVLWVASHLRYKKLRGWSIKFIWGCNGFKEWLCSQNDIQILEIEKIHGCKSYFVLPSYEYETKYNLESKLVKSKTPHILSLLCNMSHIRILKCVNFRSSKFKWTNFIQAKISTDLKELYITCSSEHERSKNSPQVMGTIDLLSLPLNVLHITYSDVYPYYPHMLELLLASSESSQIPNIFMGSCMKYDDKSKISQKQYDEFITKWNANINSRTNGMIVNRDTHDELTLKWRANITKTRTVYKRNILMEVLPYIAFCMTLIAILYIKEYFDQSQTFN